MDVNELLQRAVSHHGNGHLEQACQLYQEVLGEEPQNFDATHLYACVLSQEKYFEESILLFEKAVAINPENCTAWYNYGNTLRSFGDFNKAVLCYKKSLSISDDFPAAHKNLGLCLFQQFNFSEAEISFRTALKLDSTDFESWSQLISSLVQQHKYVEGETYLKSAYNYFPNNQWLMELQAQIFEGQSRFEEAIATYREYLQQHPDTIHIYSALSKLFFRLGCYQEAIAGFRKLLELDPSNVDAFIQLGKTYDSLELYSEEALVYQEAISNGIESAEIFWLLYRIQNQQSLYNEALVSINKCLLIDPDFYNAQQQLAFAYFAAKSTSTYIDRVIKELKGFDFNIFHKLFVALEGRIPLKFTQEKPLSSSVVSEILSLLDVSSIHAFGDSHVRTFKGIQSFHIHHIGAATAYNVSSHSSRSRSGIQVLSIIEILNPEHDALLFCLGEVDCRAHIVKQAYLQNKSICLVAQEVAERYFEFINIWRKKGFQVVVYGPYGSGSQASSVGFEFQRNYASIEFNKCLEKLCSANHITFFSLIDLIVAKKTLLTRSSFLFDDVHLATKNQSRLEIQSILLSQLLSNIKHKADLNSPNSDHPKHLIVDDGLLCFGSCDMNLSILYFGQLASSKILWQGSHPIQLSYICFDLKAIIPVTKILFSLHPKRFNESSLVVELDGVMFNQTQTNTENSFEMEACGDKIMLGRFLSIRSQSCIDLSSLTNFVVHSLTAIN